jgi:outer membrane protein assembly factor BamB
MVAVTMLVWPAAAEDWPGFRGPRRDGRSAEAGLKLKWPDGGPPLVLQVEVGDGYAMASIANGRVFVFDRVEGRERLRALDAATGRSLWTESYSVVYEDAFGFSNGPRASPLVAGDRVYTYGVTGRLRGHAVKDGAVQFDIDTTSRYGVVPNFFGVGSNPVAHGDLLLVMVGGSPPDSPSIDSGSVEPAGSAIVAFDKRSGEERYRLGDDLASYSSPIVVGQGRSAKAFAFARGGLIYFDPVRGRQKAYWPWRARRLYSVNAATPVVVGERVFVTESYGPGGLLLRIREDALEPIWRDEPRDQSIAAHWATPVHHEGYLYGTHGEKRGSAELRAVRLEDGRVMWRHRGLGRSTLTLVDGHLVVLSEEGRLLVAAATPERFEPISDFTPTDARGNPLLGYPSWNPPAVSEGRLWVRGKDRLLCYDLRPTRPPSKAQLDP